MRQHDKDTPKARPGSLSCTVCHSTMVEGVTYLCDQWCSPIAVPFPSDFSVALHQQGECRRRTHSCQFQSSLPVGLMYGLSAEHCPHVNWSKGWCKLLCAADRSPGPLSRDWTSHPFHASQCSAVAYSCCDSPFRDGGDGLYHS